MYTLRREAQEEPACCQGTPDSCLLALSDTGLCCGLQLETRLFWSPHDPVQEAECCGEGMLPLLFSPNFTESTFIILAKVLVLGFGCIFFRLVMDSCTSD